jgi:hypothetical protein
VSITCWAMSVSLVLDSWDRCLSIGIGVPDDGLESEEVQCEGGLPAGTLVEPHLEFVELMGQIRRGGNSRCKLR